MVLFFHALAIRDVFRALDEDGSGTLDTSELETAMKQMEVDCTQTEIEELIKQIDQDGKSIKSLELFFRSR